MNLTRLYWYTVEFGLIRQDDGLRIYGAGICQLEGRIDPLPRIAARRTASASISTRIMRTRYRIDTYQKTYFVIDSFEQLMEATRPDFTPIYARLADQPSIPAGEILPTDGCFIAAPAKAGPTTATSERSSDAGRRRTFSFPSSQTT